MVTPSTTTTTTVNGITKVPEEEELARKGQHTHGHGIKQGKPLRRRVRPPSPSYVSLTTSP